jgi:hypothetical protein
MAMCWNFPTGTEENKENRKVFDVIYFRIHEQKSEAIFFLGELARRDIFMVFLNFYRTFRDINSN